MMLNGRFYEMAAVAPRKQQCDFGGFVPVRTFVEPRIGNCLVGSKNYVGNADTKVRSRIELYGYFNG